MLKYCRSLEFDQAPDYGSIRKLFLDLLVERDYEYDLMFDWMPGANPSALRRHEEATQAALADAAAAGAGSGGAGKGSMPHM